MKTIESFVNRLRINFPTEETKSTFQYRIFSRYVSASTGITSIVLSATHNLPLFLTLVNAVT